MIIDDGLTGGSARTVRILGFFSFRNILAPANVPAVPVLMIRALTFPSNQSNLFLEGIEELSYLFDSRSLDLWSRSDHRDSPDYRIDSSRDNSRVVQHSDSPRTSRSSSRRRRSSKDDERDDCNYSDRCREQQELLSLQHREHEGCRSSPKQSSMSNERVLSITCFRLIIRHENDAFQSQCIAEMSETNACVPRCAFDDRRSGSNQILTEREVKEIDE